LIGCSAEILERLPKHRDPELPPFFVSSEETHLFPEIGRCYKICGTFRNGAVSHLAVPDLPNEDCKRRMSFNEAVRTVKKLNDLYDRGLMDWSGQTPKIIDQAGHSDWVASATQALQKTIPPT
jgi:hypothetical protein